jgi:hypothetical protein
MTASLLTVQSEGAPGNDPKDDLQGRLDGEGSASGELHERAEVQADAAVRARWLAVTV